MSFIRLITCVAGVYAMFLLWAIAQERLSVPFERIDGTGSDKFKSPLIMGNFQSALSSLSALAYILLRRKKSETLAESVGLVHKEAVVSKAQTNGSAKQNGSTSSPSRTHHKKASHEDPKVRYSAKALLLRYFQCSVWITCAAPFGFAALSYISYPAMVLGKSCKLVPVMIMNVLLYRRKFAPHKYLVVGMVTTGITIFMYLGDQKKGKVSAGNSNTTPYANLIGITYLLINLALDGAINSTQDEIFSRHKVTGQQMMLWINVFCTAISTVLAVLPLPHIPVIHPSPSGQTELGGFLAFAQTHPSIWVPLAQFAFTGALGQLFIFETLQHFGSLTLVTITLTRKLFTMLLSVIVYKHKLTAGQWFGAAVVFAGISVEAFVKRKEVHAKRVIQEKEKARLKQL
ncbi:UDP-galactose transporter [Coprinopsis cinerea okayama7|uniref:UDP-galactose transporter homolog 1 n=1 Tax=Coprinopsis cinerea (strain Okayama-7 / 130 / ATCC MYA-4618 / FGSC 9003) TaxID=240176 RepID=A8NRD4_COPC7|nr:UDP-galactose transporter [Coprinopsis cinerea okayama7\|eukprot:XP_001835759.1 UDP-galactose transporter [Coprinopsis cinerea okayama7\